MRCLIVGYGLLGKKLAEKLSEKGIKFLVASDDVNDAEGFRKLDITDKGAVEKLIEKEKPDAVFLTAALSDVDFCERNKETAFKVNVQGVENFANACKTHQSFLVFYSTDFVFDGEKGNYTEEDKPNPLNVYGETKAAAEQAIEKISPRFLIIRTSTLYGSTEQGPAAAGQKKSFVSWVVDSLKANKEIGIVTDQKTNPTLVDDLADVSIKLVEQNLSGLFHAAGASPVTRFEFAVLVAKHFGLMDKLIKPIVSKDLNQLAKRPKNSSLSMAKLQASGIQTNGIEQALSQLSEA